MNEAGNSIDQDDALLQAQGHAAELERSFSWVGAVGLAFSITNSWITYATSFGIPLSLGGGIAALVSLILAAVFQWIVLIGLAEFCSALPSSGGQYHYTYIVAPTKTRNFAAYIVGLLNIVAWWVNAASGTIYVAISAFGIAELWYPNMEGAHWQIYLCYLLVIFLTLIPIFTVPHKYIDYLTKGAMYLSVIGLALVSIVLLVMSRGNYHPENIVSSTASSGWSPGPAWLMAIGTGQYAFFGTGACTHIAEEMPQPSRKLPRVINMTMLIGVVTSVIWILVILAVTQDMGAVQAASLPNIEVMYQATRSKSVATFLQSYMTLLYYTCIPSQWITCSRITWAFARDNGLPLSDYWKHVSTTFNIPVRTTLLSAGFCAIYGLVYIASTEAFNSIINTTILMLNITFVVPQGIVLTRGRHHIPKRPFKLGKLGYAVNAFSIIWVTIGGIFLCFPATNPTSLESMNYNSIVIVGVMVIILALWLERRNKFRGPEIDWVFINANNRED
ncbi:hypothetical protein ACSS6W_008232 [Trichoderma asperelloides]|nr:amino acid transporter [Trichoderma asperelloides]